MVAILRDEWMAAQGGLGGLGEEEKRNSLSGKRIPSDYETRARGRKEDEHSTSLR